MPLVEIKVFENEFTREETDRLIEAVPDTMCSFTGDGVRSATWVVIQEVKSGSWGIGGKSLGLPDVRKLQEEAKR